tara:strand:- start:607 stop:2256 length:1650 start_codon:yes stop_codon:yes gene_type:complete
MKVLFVVPEIRLDSHPTNIPFWAGIFASIVEQKGGEVAILDLNALRMNYDKQFVPDELIRKEVASEKWDLIGIGGLTSTYGRIKYLCRLIRRESSDSIFIGGGGWSSYNPTEILELVPELNMICIGEGEETFSELYDEISSGGTNFEKINGLCLRDGKSFTFTQPRALIADLDTVPYPHYDILELDIYFKYSQIWYSKEAMMAKRRLSTVWERGCPRGCTFCSHNGMSRIDLQNIYGDGDRKAGEKLVRISDKENDTFQLPARWPSARYAVDNIILLHEKYGMDFFMAVDENMTSNKKWTEEFCSLYIDEGLDKKVKWGTLGDAPSVATKPELVKTLVDAGCTYISFGFESASDKVLNEDIKKGQTRAHLQKTIDTIRSSGLRPITTFMIGNPHENINDLLETVDFWIQNDAEIDPFICTPYVGSPIFYDFKDYILQQYDERLKLVNEGKFTADEKSMKAWKLDAMDKFMKECGDAFEYTATVSQNFSIAELYALKRFMYKQDTRRMVQFAYQRYEETGLEQWKVSDKWKKYDPVKIAEQELAEKIDTN